MDIAWCDAIDDVLGALVAEIEVPFPQLMDALLLEDPRQHGPEGLGWLTFIDPKHNRRASLPITTGPTREMKELGPVWHVEFDVDGRHATTSPSVHSVGDWHTPSECRWRIVEKLADEE
jgi:hypothetical protein